MCVCVCVCVRVCVCMCVVLPELWNHGSMIVLFTALITLQILTNAQTTPAGVTRSALTLQEGIPVIARMDSC